MFSRRKNTEAALRVAERHQREDAAERLLAQVPGLATLQLALEERRGAAAIGESRHMRRFVVDRAPALFELPCTDRSCTDGGHDVTRQVMASLRQRMHKFEGLHTCDGTVGNGTCGRVLRFVGSATWGD